MGVGGRGNKQAHASEEALRGGVHRPGEPGVPGVRRVHRIEDGEQGPGEEFRQGSGRLLRPSLQQHQDTNHIRRGLRGSRRPDVSPSVRKAWEYKVHPLDGVEVSSERFDSSQGVCMSLWKMVHGGVVFYWFTCLVHGSVLETNLGTSQCALIFIINP